jgi:GT2 family glycosyltransferase
MDKFVSIIVPTYKRFDLFLDCLKSLSEQDYNEENYEIIAIYDDLNCNYDQNQIKKYSKRIKNFLFEKVSHRGVALVRNYGIEIARGYLILFIDDDCQAKSNWISSFVRYMDNHPDIIGTGGTILSVMPQTFIQKYIDLKNLLRRPIRDINGNIISLITANACFRKSVVDKIGGFRKEFSDYGGEDLDISFRCRKFGKLAYCENAIVYHYHRRTLKELVKQHIFYGRGTYLVCRLNNIEINFKLLKFYTPTFFNWFKYLWYILKRVFAVSLPEFKQKNVRLSLYLPYCLLDIVRKLSFIIGVTIEYYNFKNKKTFSQQDYNHQ